MNRVRPLRPADTEQGNQGHKPRGREDAVQAGGTRRPGVMSRSLRLGKMRQVGQMSPFGSGARPGI
ncbi:hypothetical protein B0H10DRAFT_1998330, partial [Mycena sp. CBHHK59/15]